MRTPDQENSLELRIVRDVMSGASTDYSPLEGSFLWHLFKAFETVDRRNFELMRPIYVDYGPQGVTITWRAP